MQCMKDTYAHGRSFIYVIVTHNITVCAIDAVVVGY